MTQQNTENSKTLSLNPKMSRAMTFALVALLWLGLGFGLKSAWAVCTPFFSSNGIHFTNGENAANATYSNYDYWNYCTIYSSSTGVYEPANSFTWTGAQETTNFKQNWICTYNGKTNNYYASNCSWLSNITAFWNSAPNCTLTASPSTVTPGQSVTLTASCGGTPTSYLWTPNVIASVASSGTVNPTTTTTYSVEGVNSVGAGAAASVTVTVNQAAPTCTLTASPSTINLGDPSTLTASCTPAATSYAWTNSGFSSSTASGTVSPTATTSYSVTGSNTSGTSTAANATVTLNPLLDATSRTRVNASALSLNRATNRSSGTITVTNTGGTTITGPLYVFFTLPSGVTLPGVPTYGGLPYAEISIPGGLAAGATSGPATLSFADPSNARIAYTTTRSAIAF